MNYKNNVKCCIRGIRRWNKQTNISWWKYSISWFMWICNSFYEWGKIPIYEFECDKKVYYPYEIEETKNEKSMLGLTLKDLKFKKRTTFGIDYNFDNSYYFNLIVDK